MKLPLSLLWRIYAIHLIVSRPLALALQNTPLAHDISYIPWKATLGFAFMALATALCQRVAQVPLVRLIYGRRLNLDEQFWRAFSYALSALYLALAFANFAVAQLTSFEVWNMYKLIFPLVALLIFVLIVPNRLKSPAAHH